MENIKFYLEFVFLSLIHNYPNTLFHLQSGSQPYLILVFHCAYRACLRVRLYPHIYLVFQDEETACFHDHKLLFHLLALIYLCGVYRRIILVSRGLYRHPDGLSIGFRNHFAVQNAPVPL